MSDACMASLAAAASLELSKVTKPKPRERVGFSLGGGGTGEDQLMHHAARALKIETIVSYTKNANSYAHFGINVNSSKHEDI